jgi:hypothetical protein
LGEVSDSVKNTQTCLGLSDELLGSYYKNLLLNSSAILSPKYQADILKEGKGRGIAVAVGTTIADPPAHIRTSALTHTALTVDGLIFMSSTNACNAQAELGSYNASKAGL